MNETVLSYISIVVTSTSALVGIIGGFIISRALTMADNREIYKKRGKEAFDNLSKEMDKFYLLVEKSREVSDYKTKLDIFISEKKINDLFREVKEYGVKIRTSSPKLIWIGLVVLGICAFLGIILPLISLTWDKQDFPIWIQNILFFYDGTDIKKWLFLVMFIIIFILFLYFGIAMYYVFISPLYGKTKKKIDGSMKGFSSLYQKYEQRIDEFEREDRELWEKILNEKEQ